MQDTGIINFSVCNVHQAEDSSSEMLTQGLLGMKAIILERRKWIKIKLENDDNEGWVHPKAITSLNPDEQWTNSSKIIITAHYGFSYTQPDIHSQCVSDLVSGNRLRLLQETNAFYKVEYPDKRQAYVPIAISQKEDEWKKQNQLDAPHILATAHSLMGIPYIWGGTSAKGMDCSGFVRLCFLLNGGSIPRDSYQQAQVGKRLELTENLSNLQPGDLLFFGIHVPQNPIHGVRHIGIHIADGRYIHSQGYIHINSLLKNDQDYDEENTKRFLFAQRYFF